jgi:hypothetical protein
MDGLLMSRDALLAEAQDFAEEGMVDACVIRRVTGWTTDDFSGTRVPTYLSPDPYTGKCRVQQALVQSTREDAGQDDVLLLRLELQLPVVGSEGLAVGDLVTIIASRDADLVGRSLVIRDLAHKTDASSRRLQLIERTA